MRGNGIPNSGDAEFRANSGDARIPETPHSFPFIFQFLSRRFPEHGPDAEQAARLTSGMRLEHHGHLVFALGERLGNGMGDIVESAGKIEIPLLAGVGVKVGQGLLVSRKSPGFLHSDTSVFGRMVRSRVSGIGFDPGYRVRSRILGDKIPHSRAGGEDESAGSWHDGGILTPLRVPRDGSVIGAADRVGRASRLPISDAVATGPLHALSNPRPGIRWQARRPPYFVRPGGLVAEPRCAPARRASAKGTWWLNWLRPLPPIGGHPMSHRTGQEGGYEYDLPRICDPASSVFMTM